MVIVNRWTKSDADMMERLLRAGIRMPKLALMWPKLTSKQVHGRARLAMVEMGIARPPRKRKARLPKPKQAPKPVLVKTTRLPDFSPDNIDVGHGQ